MEKSKFKILGYTVQTNVTKNIPYTLRGPRGGVRRLVRQQFNPQLMYVIDSKGSISSVKGNYTFTDAGVEGLRPI